MSSQPNNLEFQKILISFDILKCLDDSVRFEFELVRAARSHRIPISSFRKMYGDWLAAAEQGGQP